MTGRRWCSRVRRRVGTTLKPLVRNRLMGGGFSGARCRRWTPVRIRRARTANNKRVRTDRVLTRTRNPRVRLCPKKKKQIVFLLDRVKRPRIFISFDLDVKHGVISKLRPLLKVSDFKSVNVLRCRLVTLLCLETNIYIFARKIIKNDLVFKIY